MDDGDRKAIAFQLLHTLNKERASFGIRDKDFARYRKHCSHKLSKLRQATGLKHGTSKAYKPTPAINAAVVQDASALLNLLSEAERALAFAHELKASIPADKAIAHDRKLQLSKLRRAFSYAEQLQHLSVDPAIAARLSKRATAEIAVYYLGIRAERAFEKHRWEEAVGDYVVRRKILRLLSDEATTSQDRVLADEEMDTTDPLIRFCAYKLGRPQSHDVDGIAGDFDEEAVTEVFPSYPTLVSDVKSEASAAKSASGMTDWDGQLAPGVQVRHLELVQPMMRAQQAIKKLSDKAKSGKSVKSMKLWDRVLSNLGEAEAIAQKLADAEQNGGQTSASTASLAHQHILQLLLEHRIRRDSILARQLQRGVRIQLPLRKDIKLPEIKRQEIAKALTAVIKLHDVIAQSLAALSDLGIVATDNAKAAGLEATEAFVRATRCYWLGLLHTLMPAPHYPSIIRITEQARSYLVQARIALQSDQVTLIPDFLAHEQLDVEGLSEKVATLEKSAKLAWMPSCVPKKTIYDIAFNYIDLPMHELEVAAGKAKPKAKRETMPVQVAKAALSTILPASGASRPTGEQDEGLENASDAAGEEKPMEQPEASKKSGWFGGLWGARK